MKKGKVHSTCEDLFEDCGKRVIIERDTDPPNPLVDYDQVFELHSVSSRISGSEGREGYESPLEEVLDEDGYGTGEYRLRDGVVAFWVSAYVHSGIALHLGTAMCAPGDSAGAGGRGWDTTPKAAFMWTDKERFERMSGKWMEIYDRDTDTRRPAKDEKEWKEYLEKIAEDELELFQRYLDGECYRYRTEVKRTFTKTYEDGRVEEGYEWEDAGDVRGGYYVDDAGDIDFPKGEGWEVFAGEHCGSLEGDEFDRPECAA